MGVVHITLNGMPYVVPDTYIAQISSEKKRYDYFYVIARKSDKKYVYYTHIDTNTIRVKFISTYYNPSLNSTINVRIKTTQGKACNFKYKTPFLVTPQSEKYKYKSRTFY